MFNSPILDVAIGLTFIFLMLSLLVSAVCEMIAGVMKWRAEHLWMGLERLLQSEAARDALYNHPLIRGLAPLRAGTSAIGVVTGGRFARLAQFARTLSRPSVGGTGWSGGHNGPSYIPSKTFALALIDVIRQPHEIVAGVRTRLESLVDDATRNPSALFVSLEKAFEEFSNDESLKPIHARLAALRERLFAAVDPAVVAPVRTQVQDLIDRLPEADRAAASRLREWIENLGRAANYVELRRDLETAVALIPSGPPAGDIRRALDDVVNRLTLGSPDAAVRELQSFISSSKDVRAALDRADESLTDLVGSLTPLLDEAAGDIDRFRENIEMWFDDGMDRVAGWYKRHTVMWQAGIGLALAVAMNVDALLITRTLWRDPAVRQSIVSQAQAAANEPHPSLERPRREFSVVASAQNPSPLTATLSAPEVSAGTTVSMAIVPAASANARQVQVESQSAYLVLNLEPNQPAETDKWQSSVTRDVPGNSVDVKPVYVRLKSNVKTESLESLRVTVNDPTIPPLAVSVVAKPTSEDQFDALRTKIETLGLPIGWRACDDKTAGVATPFLWCASDGSGRWEWTVLMAVPGMLLGWLITAAAVSLGAPFWFDTLKRVVSVRSAGKAPEERPLAPKDVPQPREPGQRPGEAGAVNSRKA